VPPSPGPSRTRIGMSGKPPPERSSKSRPAGEPTVRETTGAPASDFRPFLRISRETPTFAPLDPDRLSRPEVGVLALENFASSEISQFVSKANFFVRSW